MGNKKEKRKKRPYTAKHSVAMINLAVEAMKNKTMSSYEAEKAFGIPRRTLLDKLNNKHPKSPGCPTKLSNKEEDDTVKVLIAAADYGSPLTLLDLKIVVYRYLEGNGRLSIFNNKLPGNKWAYSFIKRNKPKLTYRVIQNIKRSRAEKSADEIKDYFTNLKLSLEGVSNENIINYDETNLTDNPGVQKCLVRRGVKYPERVLNFTKGAISIMFAITASGECLPPYVVYKAEHLYTQWTLNGPKGARFNRSKSGWFDSNLFEDWFETIILPWAKNKPGKKVLIGDNLASHINVKIVKYCEQNDIRFVFLPTNSTHITQPLDVCYFGPLKKLWREILLNYKIKNPRETTIHKGHFPDLLKKLVDKLNVKTHNIISGFKSTGIVPFNPDKVISKLPDSDQQTMSYSIDNALLDWLKETRSADPNKKVRNKKLDVPPGKSVCENDFKNLKTQSNKVELVKKNKRKRGKNLRTVLVNSDSLLQLSLTEKNPESLKNLCIRSVNTNLLPFVQNAKAPMSRTSNVKYLDDILKNDKENMPFSNIIPDCLQTNKTKINITSNVIIKAGTSQKILQSKKENTNFIKRGVTISRSALHMKLNSTTKDTVAEQRKVLDKNTHEEKLEEMTDTVEKKPNNETKKRKSRETLKAKKKTLKRTSVKRKRKTSSSQSSLTTDIEMSIADDSEYETLDDFISVCQREEQENIELSMHYGISDIEYFKESDNKLKTNSWILAQFVTKKSVKHFVGKVISIKNNVPEVKFLRKKKESKVKKGSVFTYPTVDDIWPMKHLDDIILVLPEPKICRRGQIFFNNDLSNYNIQ
ncbi:uncharacterized protein LOC128199899 [Bicyclus anynana]|uniref:Uncharacterized protein LOC128198539 n=1 Tax=Bicyclus anynana TaxID=110368 RepID=A0ABM3LN41_BICAN|nr:uncharacterized protein LOC128198539 [Bicyclus anynana]XP_052747248.1 uncharacterized protein LOC128199899 [Bicyclus anynana]